ncbi:MAG: chemotaxis protein CheW [Spirochaetaceae bacterium]|jgi:purine-binding chemotaxis protein CheW|nr:chemotaxis protein CheW [Spirochaetaceae bacterium]
MEKIRNLTQVNAELQERKAAASDTVDFKMVTFCLGGKDYGVDIMNVKEIARADKFTFVPNAPSFVRGVYNLRGDIIPIIDLRTFFHLPLSRNIENGGNDGQENMLIFHIEDRVYGTIVDKIDKVVGINSEQIQPPHPIFGDINIKYIQGVVEKSGDLYIILDVVRIFSPNQPKESAASVATSATASAENTVHDPSSALSESYDAAGATTESSLALDANGVPKSASNEDLGFIKDQLAALKHFYASSLNEEWVVRRLDEWGRTRRGTEIQLKNASDADAYIEPFYSPFSGAFWSDEYAYTLKTLLPNLASNNIQVWNAGCGKGYETYSLACILRIRYPDSRIKIWANDSDIMSIANAPNMTFEQTAVPEYCRTFLTKAHTGCAFNQQIKDSIVFEYHDITNENTLPDINLVFCRDVLSFLAPPQQDKILSDIAEKLKPGGLVILGAHEKLGDPWRPVGKDDIPAFAKG